MLVVNLSSGRYKWLGYISTTLLGCTFHHQIGFDRPKSSIYDVDVARTQEGRQRGVQQPMIFSFLLSFVHLLEYLVQV